MYEAIEVSKGANTSAPTMFVFLIVQGGTAHLRPRFSLLMSGIVLILPNCGRWKSGRMGIVAWQQWRNTRFFVNKR